MSQKTRRKPDELKKRLSRLAAFVPVFEAEGFKFAEVRGGDEIEPGVFAMPWSQFSKPAKQFYEMCYTDGWVLPEFDWSEWGRTCEARSLVKLADNPSPGPKLSEATAEQLAKVLTAIIRADRFCDGYLHSAFDSGLLLAIVRRARDLPPHSGTRP